MRKKAYIDPITDYLLHDPAEISDAGSLARGALTLSGAGTGALGVGKLFDLQHAGAPTLLPDGKPNKNLLKALALRKNVGMIGGGLFGGLTGHFLGSGLFNRPQQGIDKSDLAAILENIKASMSPKTPFEKFKDSGSEALESLKNTGILGWEAIKDQFN